MGRNLTTTRSEVFGFVEKGTTCRVCGRNVDDGRAKHCSDYCKHIVTAVMQLLNWNSVRRRIIDRDDATCQVCGFRQDWLNRGYDHLRRICEERIPDRPEGTPLTEYHELSEEEHRREREALQEWREQRNAVIEEVYGLEWENRIQWPAPETRLEVDHITPISEGGHPFDPGNLVTLCEDCHQEKTAAEASARAKTPSANELNESIFEYVEGGD